MVALSRIMRKVALDLYTQPCNLEDKLQRARALDGELEDWLQQVPSHLQAEQQSGLGLLNPRSRAAGYMKRQSVVLRLRYLNLRMVIHAVFMTDADSLKSIDAQLCREFQGWCVQAAEDAIDLIHSTFCTDNYFQTWWYNATYTLFAVSILLVAVFRQIAPNQQALEKLFAHIDRAIEILQAMDDCLVARNATAIVKRTLTRAKRVPKQALTMTRPSSQEVAVGGDPQNATDQDPQTETGDVDTLLPSHAMDYGDLDETVSDLDWLTNYAFDSTQQASFWTEWAHELDTLGT